jgi:hypothetical protein
MSAATTTSAAPSKTAKSERARTLDDLLSLDADELLLLYKHARTPKLSELDGDLAGRMLASPLGGRRLHAATRSFAEWRHFPWRGKSFKPLSDDRGEGINRVFTDTNKWFRFETFVGPSRAGDFDAVQLDYDLSPNPVVIRAVKDELRAIGPGLFLGQAYLVVRGTPTLAVYFGLESR